MKTGYSGFGCWAAILRGGASSCRGIVSCSVSLRPGSRTRWVTGTARVATVLGHETAERAFAATVRVPQLVGLSVRAAQDLALDMSLFPVQRRTKGGAAGLGTVVRLSPAAGIAVRRSTRVMIWVDRGPRGTDDRGDDGGGGGPRVPIPSGPMVPAGAK